MEKKKQDFEYEGTILTGILEFFGDMKKSLTFEGFCKYIDEGLESAIAAVGSAAGTAGAAAVGTADAFLKGEQNADKNPMLTAGGFMVENPDEYWGMPAHDREYLAALDRIYPQPHHYLHPLWEEVYGDGA